MASTMKTGQQQPHPIANHLSIINDKLTIISSKLRIPKEYLVLSSFYPVIILLGQLFIITSPSETIENYFTSKRNLVNLLFVKQGWLWTTVLYFLMVYTTYNRKVYSNNKLFSSLKRFGVVTACWWFYSQWCFGMPVMDRIFVLTGGQCSVIPESKIKGHEMSIFEKMLDGAVTDGSLGGMGDVNGYYTSNQLSSMQCRRLSGKWVGGHDPSGHIFILTLSSMFLIIEAMKFSNSVELRNQFQNIKMFKQFRKIDQIVRLILNNPLVWIVLLNGVWFWMLLMTSIYFHSLLEKLMGLLFSYCAIYLTLLV